MFVTLGEASENVVKLVPASDDVLVYVVIVATSEERVVRLLIVRHLTKGFAGRSRGLWKSYYGWWMERG